MIKQIEVLVAALATTLILLACSSEANPIWTGDCPEPCEAGTVCRDGKCVPEVDGDSNEVDDSPTDGDTETPDGDTDGDLDDDSVENLEDAEDDADPDLVDTEIDLGETDMSWDFNLTPCDHSPDMTTPLIKMSDNEVDFGAVRIGSSESAEVFICNGGGVDLSISSVQFSIETSPEFLKFTDDFPIVIPPGMQAPAYLMYVPLDSQSDTGSMIVLSDDPNTPSTTVVLRSSIKKTAILQVTPQVLQYLGASTGEVLTKQFEAKNVGLAPTSISKIVMGLGDSSPYTVTNVVQDGEEDSVTGPWILNPNEFVTVSVQMAMGATALDDKAYVRWIDGEETKDAVVELTTSDLALCAIPNAGEDQRVKPLVTVRLDGSASYDPNGTITEYKWEFEAIPAEARNPEIKNNSGEAVQGLWIPESSPTLFAETAGEYVIKLTVKDESDEGCTELKEDFVSIFVVPDETIHIQLVWSDPKNDFDLHLIKPGGTHSRDCGNEDNYNGGDCCWSNCSTNNGTNENCPPRGCPGPMNSPNWSDPDSRDDDPTLDIDDRTGRGPENINLSLPEVGDYLVTVENWDATITSQVMVRVYLFGTFRDMFIEGTDGTGIPLGYHWNVCYLRVKSASDIEVIPIENSIESSL